MARLLCILVVTGLCLVANSKTLKGVFELRLDPESELLLEGSNDERNPEIIEGQTCKPSNCLEILLNGNKKSGIYTIYPELWFKTGPFKVYCDMETDGGGWTVFQKRDNYIPRINFYRSWEDYKRGFGNLSTEFWLGNDKLYLLTNQENVVLRVDLEDFEGEKRFAVYNRFRVSNLQKNYAIDVGEYTGDAGDSMAYHNGKGFVTYDHDDVSNCAKTYKGGFWYNQCHHVNVNGLYLKGKHTSFADGINWYTWKGHYYSLKKTELKIRPKKFT